METKLSQPRVSIVTVTFNARELFRKTAASVISQRYPQLEWVVADGGSTDGTVEEIRRVAGHIAQWVSEPDRGIYDAMNKATAMATGEWVLFLNAGDTLAADDVLSRIFATDRSQADVLYGDVVKNGRVKPAPKVYKPYHRMTFCHQSSLARRRLLISHPFNTAHRLSADLEFFLTQWRLGARFSYVGLPIADFDTTGVSNTRRSDGLRDNMRVLRSVWGFPRCLPGIMRLAVPYILCRLKGK